MIDTRRRGKAKFRIGAWVSALVVFVMIVAAHPDRATADFWSWLTDIVENPNSDATDPQNVSLSGMNLPADAIVTAPGEVRTIELGRDVLELYPSTAVTVEMAAGQVVTVHLIAGTIRVKVAKRKSRTFKVDTYFLVGAVKGTVFEVATTNQASALSVFEGRVGVTSRKGVGGIDVTPGNTGTVSADDSEAKIGKTPKGGAAAAVKAAAKANSSPLAPGHQPGDPGNRPDRDVSNPSRSSPDAPAKGPSKGGSHSGAGTGDGEGEGGESGDGEGGEHGEGGEGGEGGDGEGGDDD